jgi:hypothetical protein
MSSAPLWTALSVLLFSNTAMAQGPVEQARKTFDDCVYGSVVAQLNQMPASARARADVSLLGEQGFMACSTEERVMAALLRANNVSPQSLEIALLGIRAQIKRTLQAIAANPAAYK